MHTLEFVAGIQVSVERDLAEAVSQLKALGAPLEALAEYVPQRRILFVSRPPTMAQVGEVWRLGVLLLSPGSTESPGSTDGSARGASTPMLYAAGHATRAAARLHPSNQSVSREERRDIAAAALRGGYAEGAPVNFDASPIPSEESELRALGHDSPVGVVESGGGQEVRVRWRAGASLDSAPTLREYLADRIELLTHPPQGE